MASQKGKAFGLVPQQHSGQIPVAQGQLGNITITLWAMAIIKTAPLLLCRFTF